MGTPGNNRRTLRNQKRRERKLAKSKQKRKRQRTFHCRTRTARGEREHKAVRKAKRDIKFGTWNTRGLGAPFSNLDQEVKHDCLFELVESRGWEVALLTDVKYDTCGVWSFATQTQEWTIVAHGRVAVALNEEWAQRWREGGARWPVHP